MRSTGPNCAITEFRTVPAEGVKVACIAHKISPTFLRARSRMSGRDSCTKPSTCGVQTARRAQTSSAGSLRSQRNATARDTTEATRTAEETKAADARRRVCIAQQVRGAWAISKRQPSTARAGRCNACVCTGSCLISQTVNIARARYLSTATAHGAFASTSACSIVARTLSVRRCAPLL